MPPRPASSLLATALVTAAALLAPAPARSQTSSQPRSAQSPLTGSITSHPGWPVAKPDDVRSVEALLNALYSTLSGPAGQPRDWHRFRTLFLPDAQLIPIRTLPGGHNDAVVLTPDLYVERAARTMEFEGFFERGTHTTTLQFGPMLTVWSTYESRHHESDPKPFARGVNSFQILRDGERFWIVNLVWNAETPGNPIPPQFSSTADLNHTSSTTPTLLNTPFSGRWVGSFEHRDMNSHQPSSTPVWLTMEPSSNGDAVTFAYSYDDGIRKTVNERTVLSLAPAYSMATVLADGSQKPVTYRVEGLDGLRVNGRGTLTLLGSETELNHRVDTRITLSIDPKLFTWRKETRLPGPNHDFTLRDSYTLTRDSSS